MTALTWRVALRSIEIAMAAYVVSALLTAFFLHA